MELVFNRAAFHAIKEKLDKKKYMDSGATQAMNPATKPAPEPKGAMKAESGEQFIQRGETEKLEYPKVKKESSAMNKEAKQSLPGSEKINAEEPLGGGGEKGKLTFPTKPAAAPKGSLPAETEAQKQIEDGEQGKIQHGQSKGKDIKIDWNVAVDSGVAAKFMEKGDKGDIKKAPAHAKEPGVSQHKEPGADAFIDGGETTKPIQKQFSVSWKRYSSEEKKEIIDQAVNCAISDLEVMASKLGKKISETTLADVHAKLIEVRATLTKTGSVNLTPAKPADTPLKATAAAKEPVKTELDEDKAAEEIGKNIF